MPAIRTRIAPSPTGHLHIGTARTALFNYLFAKKQGGHFVVRIEDTDLERSDEKYETDIFDGLKWLGIEADESPVRGGDFAPYRQSQRLETYERFLQKLLRERRAFHCPHSERELEDEKKKQLDGKEPPRHICSARDRQLQSGIIRLKNERTAPIIFSDLIRGEISFDPELLGDFSLAKDLRTPLYNFAVVIDDHEMQISHVIRGEDHIPNTPKQLLLWAALWPDEPPPAYAHLPLILGPDRAKLSKRHGATAIREFRDAGYLPEALVNFMALLGWNPGGKQEIFSRQELINAFSLEQVQKSGAIFNIEKLDWMNGEYIRKKSVPELTELCRLHLADFLQTPNSKSQFPNEYVQQVVALEQPRMKTLADIRAAEFFFRLPDYPPLLLSWEHMSLDAVRGELNRATGLIDKIPESEFTKKNLETGFLQEIGKGSKGELLWPLRVALSGKEASPGPFEIMELLGKVETLGRIQEAAAKLTSPETKGET